MTLPCRLWSSKELHMVEVQSEAVVNRLQLWVDILLVRSCSFPLDCIPPLRVDQAYVCFCIVTQSLITPHREGGRKG